MSSGRICLLVAVDRAFGDRHGGRSYRAHGSAGVPAGLVSDRMDRFPGEQLLWHFS